MYSTHEDYLHTLYKQL